MGGTRSALIVANSDYTDAELARLRSPVGDARALEAVLRDPQIGGFEVRTLPGPGGHHGVQPAPSVFTSASGPSASGPAEAARLTDGPGAPRRPVVCERPLDAMAERLPSLTCS